MSETMSCNCAWTPDFEKHYNPKCFNCEGDLTITGVCSCIFQCGCMFGYVCVKCNKKQMPKMGHGYCRSVRAVRRMLKPGRCIVFGCQKPPVEDGHSYCSFDHAKLDGSRCT